jgi:hypothetical protein
MKIGRLNRWRALDVENYVDALAMAVAASTIEVAWHDTENPSDSPHFAGSTVFGVHRYMLYRWAKSEHITIHRRGAMLFFDPSEVYNFIINGEGTQWGASPQKDKIYEWYQWKVVRSGSIEQPYHSASWCLNFFDFIY